MKTYAIYYRHVDSNITSVVYIWADSRCQAIDDGLAYIVEAERMELSEIDICFIEEVEYYG